MKQKLQLKQADGSWLWVKSFSMDCIVCTTSKRQALPIKFRWYENFYLIAKKRFPDKEFRMAETRGEL